MQSKKLVKVIKYFLIQSSKMHNILDNKEKLNTYMLCVINVSMYVDSFASRLMLSFSNCNHSHLHMLDKYSFLLIIRMHIKIYKY